MNLRAPPQICWEVGVKWMNSFISLFVNLLHGNKATVSKCSQSKSLQSVLDQTSARNNKHTSLPTETQTDVVSVRSVVLIHYEWLHQLVCRCWSSTSTFIADFLDFMWSYLLIFVSSLQLFVILWPITDILAHLLV